MDTFQCGGWLHITVMDGGDDVLVKLKHLDDHVPYWTIDVPEEIQSFVLKMWKLVPHRCIPFYHFKMLYLFIYL